jgi:2-iminobutanoate/2-iminopropanoate deaminase
MARKVETLRPPNTPAPLGPYSHIIRAGSFVSISAIAGMNPANGELVGSDAYSQAKQILALFDGMLVYAGTDLHHVVHVNVFLKDMDDLDEMNRAFGEAMGTHRPARTVVEVPDLPKLGALLTMNLTAVVVD